MSSTSCITISTATGCTIWSVCGFNTFFDHDHVIVTDSTDHLAYALENNSSANPELFANAELGRVIDLLRGRAQPNSDEHYQEPSLDPITNLGHPRGIQRLQTFMKRPAIVAGVVAELPALAGPISGAQPPLIMTVKYLDGQLLSDIGIRFDLPGLRALGSEAGKTTSMSTSLPTAPVPLSRALPGCRTSPAQASSVPCCLSWRSLSAVSR